MTDERTKFEAWAVDGRHMGAMEREFAWDAWQAVLASQQKAVAGLDEVALRVAKEVFAPFHVETEGQDFIDFAHRLIAELTKGQEPVAWMDERHNIYTVLPTFMKKDYTALYTNPIPAVQTGWKLVGWLDGRDRFFYADDPMYKNRHDGMREVFAAAPEVKS